MQTPQEVFDGFSNDSKDELYPNYWFLKSLARGKILEIGSHAGRSTSCFLLGLEKNGGHLYSVDIDNSWRDRFGGPLWTFINKDSKYVEEVMSQVQAPLDILLIDGDHTHPAVERDFYGYIPYVREGGVILVHDINVAGPQHLIDVCETYHKFLFETGYTHFELPGVCGMGVIYKGA
jgi:predicted O-methyltransferase YrrM